MKRINTRSMFKTTKHMHNKIFMLSQQFGMVKGSLVSVHKMIKDAVVERWDLDNDFKWQRVKKILDDAFVEALKISKQKTLRVQDGKKINNKNSG